MIFSILFLTANVVGAGEIYFEGEKADWGEPLNVEGRILLPFRPLFQALGAEVDWNEQDRIISAKKDSLILQLVPEKRLVKINDYYQVLDIAPQIINNISYVPLRFVGETLGALVHYESGSKRVFLQSGFAVTSLPTKPLWTKAPLICIDPGHQEKPDYRMEKVSPFTSAEKYRVAPGTRGVATGKSEYVLNLEVGLLLKEALESSGYQVLMTRETNSVNISNQERAELANEREADIVLRLHADASGSSSRSGISILAPAKTGNYQSEIFAESELLAFLVLDSMLEATGANPLGVVYRSDLTGFNWSKVPVVLIELGFMTNSTEDVLLSEPSYQQKLVEGMHKGIDAYFGK